MARRIVSASATECGPSLKAMAPASARRPISAISWPRSPLVSAAEGKMRTFASIARAAQDEVDDRRIVDGQGWCPGA